jgi:hypothetical protein
MCGFGLLDNKFGFFLGYKMFLKAGNKILGGLAWGKSGQWFGKTLKQKGGLSRPKQKEIVLSSVGDSSKLIKPVLKSKLNLRDALRVNKTGYEAVSALRSDSKPEAVDLAEDNSWALDREISTMKFDELTSQIVNKSMDIDQKIHPRIKQQLIRDDISDLERTRLTSELNEIKTSLPNAAILKPLFWNFNCATLESLETTATIISA